jgi:hypothetical protein
LETFLPLPGLTNVLISMDYAKTHGMISHPFAVAMSPVLFLSLFSFMKRLIYSSTFVNNFGCPLLEVLF